MFHSPPVVPTSNARYTFRTDHGELGHWGKLWGLKCGLAGKRDWGEVTQNGEKRRSQEKERKKVGAYVTADCCELRKGNFFLFRGLTKSK